MTNIEARKITLHEMSLRDGMHPLRHQMSLEQMVAVARAADETGIPWIEVTRGDGLGGSSVNDGFAAYGDVDYLRAVVPQMKQARISTLLLPGIGTVDTLKEAMDCGVSGVRVATHGTEADYCAEQHIAHAAEFGLDTVGFLIMAHRASPEKLVEQALLMESYGAGTVYCTACGGAEACRHPALHLGRWHLVRMGKRADLTNNTTSRSRA